MADRRGVLCAMGEYTDLIVPALQASLPGEEVRSLPSERPADVLVTLAPSPADLDAAVAAGIRWVHVLATGVDNVPLDRLTEQVVTCSRGASAPAIAEFVLAAMLAFEKQLPDVWVTEPPETWNIASLGGLRGRTAGIIGLGEIGRAVATRALAFDMRVVSMRRSGAPTDIEGVDVVRELGQLLGQSDHIVVAAPATAETFHLIDTAALASVKPSAHLVNVARGSLVDQDALLRALDEGRLAMASLDVTDPEPLPPGHALYRAPKVRLSPHVSWSSPDTIGRTLQAFVDNHRRYRAGEPLAGLVDLATGY